MTNEQQITTIKQHLIVKDGKVFATSLDLANIFKKKHKDVLKAIRNLECSAEFRGRNFAPTFYEVPGPNNSFRQEPMAEMTRDGFTMLAMGFTGPEAAKFREAYIAAFNQIEAELSALQAENPVIDNLVGAVANLLVMVGKLSARVERMEAAQPAAGMAPGEYPLKDRPAAVQTAFGLAYVNTATFLLFAQARQHPGSQASRQLSSALATRRDFHAHLPEPLQTIEKLKLGLLKQNPLWSDIMNCQRTGLTNAAIARVCGCHPATLRKHLRKMAAYGLFNDPYSSLVGVGQITTGEGKA